MIGTILNAAAILVGGALGLTKVRDLSPTAQSRLKITMGAFTVWIGLSISCSGFHGSFRQIGKELVIALLALILGRLAGRALRLQRTLNQLGRYAKQKFAQAQTAADRRVSDGFITGTILFCAGPIAILGALQDGLCEDFRTLAVKALMDGLATMAFARTFGWGVLLSAVPVLTWQGTLAVCARALEPYLNDHALLDSVSVTGGLLIFCIALIMLELKKIELADYLPSLFFAPLLTWCWF
jgi:uncharacterized membrane protein YqgA involved in biofilm formation